MLFIWRVPVCRQALCYSCGSCDVITVVMFSESQQTFNNRFDWRSHMFPLQCAKWLIFSWCITSFHSYNFEIYLVCGRCSSNHVCWICRLFQDWDRVQQLLQRPCLHLWRYIFFFLYTCVCVCTYVYIYTPWSKASKAHSFPCTPWGLSYLLL